MVANTIDSIVGHAPGIVCTEDQLFASAFRTVSSRVSMLNGFGMESTNPKSF